MNRTPGILFALMLAAFCFNLTLLTSPAVHAAPAGEKEKKAGKACLIKGNISRSGERIYHVPGGRWYDATRIDPRKGERWFCSEAEARAAGWRRAKR